MAAATYNFEIEQGATLTKPFVWKTNINNPIDITGYVARMQIRSSVKSTEILLELTTENDRIVLGTTEGTITLQLDAITTSNINWTKGVYDLELISADGIVTRLIQGDITVSKEVTR
jgi:hypothetical protein